MRRISGAAQQLAYHAYCLGTKILQSPRILRERQPNFLSDEVVTPARGDRFAIVVNYARFGLTEDFIDLLAALERGGINAIVVCNGQLRPEEMAALRPLVHRILVRRNIGRDMGAYRAATLHLHRTGLQASRVLYFNDSIIYLRGSGLDAMVGALADSTYDVTGTFENHEFVHHIGSFVFSVSGAVFADQEILRFWQRYRPYDLRPYAIRHGEVGFSECIRRCGYRVDVIYAADKLAARLDAMPFPALVEHLRYIPFGAFRDYVLSDLLGGATKTGAMLYGKQPDAAPASPRTPTLSAYRSRTTQANEDSEARAQLLRLADRIKREVLVSHMMGLVIHGSQVHHGFGLFHRVMDSPLVKKDLLMRGVFFEYDCARILDHLPIGRRSTIMRELINRGRPLNTRGFHHFKIRHGLI